MGDMLDLLEHPPSSQDLTNRYRNLCDDPRFQNLPGKIELDIWGRIIMSPASTQHGILQARLIQRLESLGGIVIAEASVLTRLGVMVADVAWISTPQNLAAELPTPLDKAPNLCIEIASPSNSRKELDDKVAAYLSAGATETWLVFPKNRRVLFFGGNGEASRSQFEVKLEGLFDY